MFFTEEVDSMYSYKECEEVYNTEKVNGKDQHMSQIPPFCNTSIFNIVLLSSLRINKEAFFFNLSIQKHKLY
jgi:hypothetical protein